VPASGSRSHVRTRVARPGDLPVVLSLVRQHRADSHAEGVLTGQAPGSAAAAGFRRLLADADHSVVLAVLPGTTTRSGDTPGDQVVGLAVLGLDPLSVVLGVPQVTVDNFVVHTDHRRRGVGAALLAAAADHAERCGAAHVVTRRSGSGSSPAWASPRCTPGGSCPARTWCAPSPAGGAAASRSRCRGAGGRGGRCQPRCSRRSAGRWRPEPQSARVMQVSRAVAVTRPASSVTSTRNVDRVRPRRTGVHTAVTVPDVAARR
jgi:GNAT superfamily N-acetyltransferase